MRRIPVGPEFHRRELTRGIEIILALRKLLRHHLVGLVLLEAHFSRKPEVTVDYVTERLQGLFGADTVRRKLGRMHEAGAVQTHQVGRTIYFQLTPETADAAFRILQNTQAR